VEKGYVSSEFIVKSGRKKNATITGYASVFGVVDFHNDIIVKGAFKKAKANKIRLLWQHESKKPIGVITLLEEDEYGLKMEAEINSNTVAGAEAAELVRQKAICGLSIGFVIESSNYNKEGIRVIDGINLMEVSIVTFPANRSAEIQAIKNRDKEKGSYEESLDTLQGLIKKLENY